jgi:hypothetical protein
MGVGFIRRFDQDPGLAVLTAIEGVVIIDRDPPASITGVGSGTVCCVGEFEDGAFNTPLELAGGGDFLATFGGFGFNYAGAPSQNPCARSRKADAAINPEFWNGNGFIALVNKRFSRLICVRVDTSVGSVQFTRLAAISGKSDFSFALTTGQTLLIDIGAGNQTATFTGVAAGKLSAAGVYPSGFTGGEKTTIIIDSVSFNIVFQAADSTQAQVMARMNSFFGYTAATDGGGGKIQLTGRIPGTAGNIQIVSIDAAVATATGFAAGASTPGTGNVPNLNAVVDADLQAVITAIGGLAGVITDRDATGALRLTATALGGTGTIKVTSASTALAFGFAPLDTVISAASGTAGFIPAGTRVRTAGGAEWVTMQTIAITAASAGPYSVKVRPATDDGTSLTSGVGTIVKVPFAIGLGAFAVTNGIAVTAALTEAQIDAQYVTAMATTVNLANVVKETNTIISARQSNVMRSQLRQNVFDASSNGCFGRMTVIRPPLGTTRVAAKSTAAQPGVGTYRNKRVAYAYPGGNTFVPQIAALGTAGGAGFTADGNIDVGMDGFVACLMSNLAPEENIGQQTNFISLVNSIEVNNADVQNLTIADYIAFKASGIVALRIDNGDVFVESSITSVDPLTFSNLVPLERQRFADFLTDTLSLRLMAISKKLQTRDRRAQAVSEIDTFLSGLQSKEFPINQRIDSYLLDPKSGNTAASTAAGVFRIIMKVKTLAAFLDIVLDATVGPSVVTVQAA